MYTPLLPTLLLFSMSTELNECDAGPIKDLTPSPALKPILAKPHSISPYMKNTNVHCPSVAITTWNEFSCNSNERYTTHSVSAVFKWYHAVRCYSRWITKHLLCTSDTPTNSATRSHVAITSLVGVKLPEDGNNSWISLRALWRRVGLDVCL